MPRPPIDWEAPAYLDAGALDDELRRVAGVCHTCRRCEDLCESFPRLFDLIDRAGSVAAAVKSAGFESVGAACTLCDMCYPVCPYTPPHVHAVDFPALMVRQRARALRDGGVGPMERALGETDRNGRWLGTFAPLANWAARRGNRLTRSLMQAFAGIHRDAVLPRFHARRFSRRARASPPPVNQSAPAAGRKAVIYATCFVEYNNPGIGRAAQGVLAKNGVETRIVYDECCGMPQLERGDVAEVCRRARRVAATLGSWIERGWDVVAPIPSCALMMKTTWPQYLPDDPAVARLAERTHDISEYIVGIARAEGLAEGTGAARRQDRTSPGLSRQGPGHRCEGCRHAAHDPAEQRADDAALRGARRHLGRDEAEFRDRHEGRRAGHPAGGRERPPLPRLGVSARGRAHRAGDGADRRGPRTPDARPSPDRADGDELWHRHLRSPSISTRRRR